MAYFNDGEDEQDVPELDVKPLGGVQGTNAFIQMVFISTQFTSIICGVDSL